jgi:hypothetical protein
LRDDLEAEKLAVDSIGFDHPIQGRSFFDAWSSGMPFLKLSGFQNRAIQSVKNISKNGSESMTYQKK